MRSESFSGDIVFTLIVIGILVGALWLILWGAKVVWKRLLEGKGAKGAEPELPPAPAQASIPAGLWLLLIVGFGLIFWYFTPKQKVPNPPPASGYSMRALVIVGGVGAVLGGALVLFLFLRVLDPGVRRTQKRAGTGDREGAIEDLREQIELKGATQDRANALGLLLMEVEKWDEAAGLFRKAEELGAVKGVCRANLGMALLKAGKPEEALPVLQEAARSAPQVPMLTCLIHLHLAQAQAALGRWDEAREQFHQAEAAVSSVLGPQRATLHKEIEASRWVERGPQVPESLAPSAAD